MGTIKEAAESTIPEAFDPEEIVPARVGYLVELERRGFSFGVAWAERWIPVEEELPPANEMIFVKRQNGDDESDCDYGVAYVEENRDWNIRMYLGHDYDLPTHWRPIKHK